MPYYPSNKISPNQYTKGGEYQILATGQPYIGYYYTTFTGQIFTGKNPQDLPNKELTLWQHGGNTNKNDSGIEYFFNKDSEYYNLTKQNLTVKPVIDTSELPKYEYPTPSIEDYAVGEFLRYFFKKRNESIFIEVLLPQYENFSSNPSSYATTLYKPFSLPWKITGNMEDVARVNTNIVALTERTEQARGLNTILSDPLQFYGLYTNGTEFVLESGIPYVGLYHVHPGKGPMVGIKHVSTSHSRLFKAGEPTNIGTSPSIDIPDSPDTYTPQGY